ncbi:hypothetical protein M446_2534 [Methylobacterium sp. 4-46]|nr:hypothetical protein M446_2534 [Methylobacterium sp. 4-46]
MKPHTAAGPRASCCHGVAGAVTRPTSTSRERTNAPDNGRSCNSTPRNHHEELRTEWIRHCLSSVLMIFIPPCTRVSMTTIRQLIQTSPAKATELLARLAETSENAVKTRERLLAELKSELELSAQLEEEHLFPVLRKHKETRELVAQALNDNRQTRRLLAELEQTPKSSEEFAPKVAELRKVFQQSVRDERKELLPTVMKVLSDEEAQTVAGKIEDGKAEVEEARRVEAEQRRAEQKRERDQAEADEARRVEAEQRRAEQKRERDRAEEVLAREKEAADRERSSRAAARQAAEQVRQAAEVVEESSRTVIRTAAEGAQRTAAAPLSSGSLFWDAMFGMWGFPQGRSVARSATAPASSTRQSTHEEEVIPLAEETLIVGKHTVNSGTTTVRRYVVENSVEQKVALYDERVVVERRRPATDAVTGEALTELTVEMIETSEVPIVGKGVKVREEVVVRRERTKRIETVRDTVRRDEVEISNTKERAANARPNLAYSNK